MDDSVAPPGARLKPREIARRVLAWWDVHRRDLPWRAAPGETPDPYRVWLSEILLQQTTASAAAPYFLKFVARWPRVEALAAASLDEVMSAFAGLGYYSARAQSPCLRARRSRGAAGVSRAARRNCARCPASAPTRPPRSRRSPMTRRRRRSTAISRASWRGFTPWRRRSRERGARSGRRRRR